VSRVRNQWRTRLSIQLRGLAFLAVLAGLLVLSVLAYGKAFTPVSWVTVRTDHTGLQLNAGADVKVRGVVVGEVREVTADGSGAALRLALDPAVVGGIAANVTARLVPKTLFGEKYVDLVAPSTGTPVAGLRSGAVIGQDRSQTAVELEQILDRTLPLLQAIAPDKLATVLGALAYALDGRGERTGADLVSLDTILRQLNDEMPTIGDDVRRLADVVDTYDGAADDILAILRDVTVTARTVTDQRAQLAGLLADTTDVADTARIFLDRHGDRLIQLGQVTRPVLDLLAAYSPEYPCLLRGVVVLQPQVDDVFADGRMHITLEVTKDNGKYVAGRDDPVYGAASGPNCRGLPDPAVPAPPVPVADGYDYGSARSPLDVQAPMGYAGTAEERALVKPLVGAATGVPASEVPDVAVLLWGPLLRGAVVSAQ
jgi:phospholipid/cholesterol/gamma-HCH transport system substrate-binding protein